MFNEEKMYAASQIAHKYAEKEKLDKLINSRPKKNNTEEEDEWFSMLLGSIRTKDFPKETREKIKIEIIRVISTDSAKLEETIMKIMENYCPGFHTR